MSDEANEDAQSPFKDIVALARSHAPADFRFRTERYEFVDDIPAFDLLTGSAEARTRIEAGDAPRDVAEALSRVGEPEIAVRAAALEAFARVAM